MHLHQVARVQIRTEHFPLQLLCGANSDILAFSFGTGIEQSDSMIQSFRRFLADYDSPPEHTESDSGLSCSFQANRVLPMVCILIDPSHKNIYDPANWRSPGDKDTARMMTTWGHGTISIATDFEGDAFLWAFTIFMTAIRQVQSFENRIRTAMS